MLPCLRLIWEEGWVHFISTAKWGEPLQKFSFRSVSLTEELTVAAFSSLVLDFTAVPSTHRDPSQGDADVRSPS
jgi:hypothetical protein